MFDDDSHDGFDMHDAALLGTGYALMRHGQDRQAAQIINGINQTPNSIEIDVHIDGPEPEEFAPINALDWTTVQIPESFDDYIGQEPLKRQVAVHMKSSQKRGERFPHSLFASGYPGVGKTTVARMIAKMLGVDIFEMVPPFRIEAVAEAAESLMPHDVLFIDEIHKLADNGGKGAEFLLKLLEDGVIFMPNGDVIQLPNITVIGATTEPDKLPAPVLDRFAFKPYFQAYSWEDMSKITVRFAYIHKVPEIADDDDLIVDLAYAARSTPRVVEKYVLAARALEDTLERVPSAAEVLEFMEVEPDGLTRDHIHYLTAMRQYFAREAKDGGYEFIVGEAAIMQILRETKQGIQRIEAFLVERGLIDRTPRGRRLTERGIARAEQFIDQGKGAANVA